LQLSIITINYNNKKGLIKTINSVSKQKNFSKHSYEFIVIDGDSNDGSKYIIRKSKVISKYKMEKDRGIADAFNKGINLSKGKYLYFLNSGDVFYSSNSLKKILSKIFNKDIYVYKIAITNNNGLILNIVGKKIDLLKQVKRNYLPHQGMIIKKKLFKVFGNYDITYELGMDYEWSTRLIKNYKTIQLEFSNDILSKMNNCGVSQKYFIKTFMAYHKARLKNNITNFFVSISLSICFIFKRIIGECLRKILKLI